MICASGVTAGRSGIATTASRRRRTLGGPEERG
jgi:hypothetical protein